MAASLHTFRLLCENPGAFTLGLGQRVGKLELTQHSSISVATQALIILFFWFLSAGCHHGPRSRGTSAFIYIGGGSGDVFFAQDLEFLYRTAAREYAWKIRRTVHVLLLHFGPKLSRVVWPENN